MRNFPLKAKVECTDAPCGKSVTVIVDPTTEKVTHVVVEENKRPHMQRLVPVDRVEHTSRNLIRLNCPQTELSTMEPFIVTRYVEKTGPNYPPGFKGGEPSPPNPAPPKTVPVQTYYIPAGKLAAAPGMPVEATDGWVGKVDELLLDPDSDRITHVVMREGHIWGQKQVVLPVSAIDHVSKETVHLNLDRQAIAAMAAIPLDREHGVTDVGLIIFTFNDRAKAQEAFKTLQQLKKRKELDILNVAVLVKDEAGKASIRESEDVSPKHGALFGAITGGLIGLVGGPVGAVIGAAAGAATGGKAAGWIDMGFPDKYLHEVQNKLQAGNSALVVLASRQTAPQVSEALADQADEILHQTLTGH